MFNPPFIINLYPISHQICHLLINTSLISLRRRCQIFEIILFYYKKFSSLWSIEKNEIKVLYFLIFLKLSKYSIHIMFKTQNINFHLDTLSAFSIIRCEVRVLGFLTRLKCIFVQIRIFSAASESPQKHRCLYSWRMRCFISQLIRIRWPESMARYFASPMLCILCCTVRCS